MLTKSKRTSKRTSKKISRTRKKSKDLKDHKCVWRMSDHEFRNSSRCTICRKEKTRMNGYYKYTN